MLLGLLWALDSMGMGGMVSQTSSLLLAYLACLAYLPSSHGKGPLCCIMLVT